jgi:hypothetical protein
VVVGMEPIKTTPEEDRAIRSLKRLAKKWPKSLWLFSASGRLHVMRCDENGQAVMTKNGGSDPDYSITTINIKNDGGDW